MLHGQVTLDAAVRVVPYVSTAYNSVRVRVSVRVSVSISISIRIRVMINVRESVSGTVLLGVSFMVRVILRFRVRIRVRKIDSPLLVPVVSKCACLVHSFSGLKMPLGSAS